MIRDPLFRAILSRLGEQVDDKLFQLFAVDVVRQDFPSAVPVLGGADAGLDGAVASHEGPRVPIIATTSDRVLDNVRRNLASYESAWRAFGGGVVVVTSAELSPRREKHVFDAVAATGFRILQLYQRHAVAVRLYHSPHWRNELLGIPGNPPALSQISPRPVAVPGLPLVGRDAALSWLGESAGDRLLVGLPGSGKTALLERLMRDEAAYFVTVADAGQIADGVRELTPTALVVDDAHARIDVLTEVIRVRSLTGATFDIIATAWKGFADQIRGNLQLASTQLHELALLSRTHVAEVIKNLGIGGPDWLIASLLDQADGRVGLAVTLARLCLLGDVREVALGDALLRSVRSWGAQMGADAVPWLAPFAVAGRAGLALDEVARALGHSTLDLHEKLFRIGSTGVIRPRTSSEGRQMIVVEPETLRASLVRTVYFGPGATLDPDPILNLVRAPCEAARTLIGAQHQGARIPQEVVEGLLGQCGDEETWGAYAWLGPREAAWALDQRPSFLARIAHAALAHIPERAVAALLDLAVGDDRALNSHPDHGLRVLHDWVKDSGRSGGKGVEQRRALVSGILSWAGHEPKRASLAQRALLLALDPKVERYRPDPVDDASLRIEWGVLAKDCLLEVVQLWGVVVEFLRAQREVEWRELLEHCNRWIYLGDPHGVSDEVAAAVAPLVQQMIDDVVSLAQGHPGVIAELLRHASLRRYHIAQAEDPVFVTLFPVIDSRRWRQHELASVERALALAESWSSLDPVEVLTDVARCQREASAAGITYPDLTALVLARIAKVTEEPLAWLDAAFQVPLSPGSEQPFLGEVLRQRVAGWQERLNTLLGDPRRAIAAAATAICVDDLPDALVQRCIEAIAANPDVVQTAWLREQIPLAYRRPLLASSDPGVLTAAVVGEWWCRKEGHGRPELDEAWRAAVLHVPPEEYEIKEILEAEPGLASRWLTVQAAESEAYLAHAAREAILTALRQVEPTEWPDHIEAWERRGGIRPLLTDLIDGKPELYTAVLAEPRLSEYHLAGVMGEPGPVWVERVRLALNAGHAAELIARAWVYGWFTGFTGSEMAYWTRRFESLPNSPPQDQAIAAVVDSCRSLVRAEWDRAREREQEEAIHGGLR